MPNKSSREKLPNQAAPTAPAPHVANPDSRSVGPAGSSARTAGSSASSGAAGLAGISVDFKIDETEGAIWWIDVSADGCTFRLSPGEVFLLELTHANYNALFSLLLASWVNGYSKVTVRSLTHDSDPIPGTSTVRRVLSALVWPMK